MVDAKRVINGTYGEAWLESKYLNEITGLEAKITLNKSDVIQCGTLMQGSKVTGAKGTGTLKMNKVSTYSSSLISSYLKKGTFPGLTLISNLADPDAYGAERVMLTGVTFDELTLANWAAGALGEESIPFTFDGYDFVDIIKTK